VSEETSHEERTLIAWAYLLGDQELEYLLAEAHRVSVSQQQRYSGLDSKVIAIVGWAIVGIGTLLIAGDLRLGSSAEGLASVFVIAGATVAVSSGVATLWPRDWAPQLDLSWYSEWEQPRAHLVKGRTLVALIQGSALNRKELDRRNTWLQVAVLGLVIEFTALVATLILSAQCG